MPNPPLRPSFRYPLQIPSGTVPDEVVNVLQSHSDSITDINQAIAALTGKFNSLKTGTGGATVVGGSTSVTQIINGSNFPGLGGVNNQIGQTAYTPITADNGIFILFGDSAPVAVTLNSAMVTPYFFFASNFGSSNVTLTPTTGTINQPTIPVGGLYLVVFDGVNWWNAAIITGGSSVIPIPAMMLVEPDQPEMPMMIPGTPGAPGVAGPVGPGGQPGASILLDPEPPPEPMMIPGAPGAPGAPGISGPAGAPGPAILMAPDAPEEPLMIPGAPGPAGPAGATGPAGSGVPIFLTPDSPEEPMMIPGPPGTGGGGGGVTSVGLAMPPEFIVTGSPVTTSGTLTASKGGIYTGNTATASISTTGTLTGAFGSNITAGNTIICITYSNTTPPTPSDGVNIYNPITGSLAGAFINMQVFEAVNVAGGATTITATVSGARGAFSAWEVRNVVGVSPFDVTAFNSITGGGSTSTSATATTTNPADYIMGISIVQGAATPTASSWNSPLTARVTAGSSDVNNNWTFMGDGNVTVAGSTSATFNVNTGTQVINVIMIALKAAVLVDDWNGRVGHVLPAANDYSFSQISGVAAPGQMTVMGASGASHSSGAAPDPGSTAGSTRFLCENATWTNPAGGTGTDYFADPTVTKTVPSTGSFTTAASTGATVTLSSHTDRVIMNVTKGTSNQAGFAYNAYPGANFTLTVQLLVHTHIWNNGTQRWGLAVQDGTNKIYRASIKDVSVSGSTCQLVHETQPTVTSTTFTQLFASWWQGWPFSGTPVWIRMQQTGGNWVTFTSQDGLNWDQLDTVATSTLGSLSNVGFIILDTANDQPFNVSIFSWTLTTP